MCWWLWSMQILYDQSLSADTSPSIPVLCTGWSCLPSFLSEDSSRFSSHDTIRRSSLVETEQKRHRDKMVVVMCWRNLSCDSRSTDIFQCFGFLLILLVAGVDELDRAGVPVHLQSFIDGWSMTFKAWSWHQWYVSKPSSSTGPPRPLSIQDHCPIFSRLLASSCQQLNSPSKDLEFVCWHRLWCWLRT